MWIGVCALLLVWAHAVHAPEVKIDRIEYHGWAGCYRVSNGSVELLYVPQVGRIMRQAKSQILNAKC